MMKLSAAPNHDRYLFPSVAETVVFLYQLLVVGENEGVLFVASTGDRVNRMLDQSSLWSDEPGSSCVYEPQVKMLTNGTKSFIWGHIVF